MHEAFYNNRNKAIKIFIIISYHVWSFRIISCIISPVTIGVYDVL
jgi:hypothetical protein